MRVFIFGSSIAYCHFNFHDQAKESILPVKFSKASKASAFAISESGLALTASHSLKDYEASTLDGEYIQVLDYDSENDLALVQFPRHKRWSYLELGDSDELQPGDKIYHYGLAYNRIVGFQGHYQGSDDKSLWANTEMTHGMSGGPALNEKGQVVGVNQGHLNCRGASSKQNPAHTGPSKYIPVNKAKEFLSRKLKLGSKGYEIIT